MTIFKLTEKLENGTFIQHELKEIENYWIPTIFGLEILDDTIFILDITDSTELFKIGFKKKPKDTARK